MDDPILEYNEEDNNMFVIAKAVIPTEYTRAADIIRRKNGTKVSCELLIDSMCYDEEHDVLELIDFRFEGCTLLGAESNGTEVQEGMKGASLTIDDFLADKNKFECSSDNNLYQTLQNDFESYKLTHSYSNADFEELAAYKKTCENEKLREKKESILAMDCFNVLANNEDFETLKETIDDYSVNDLEKEAKVILANYFVESKKQESQSSMHLFGQAHTEHKEKAYGTLFD